MTSTKNKLLNTVLNRDGAISLRAGANRTPANSRHTSYARIALIDKFRRQLERVRILGKAKVFHIRSLNRFNACERHRARPSPRGSIADCDCIGVAQLDSGESGR